MPLMPVSIVVRLSVLSQIACIDHIDNCLIGGETTCSSTKISGYFTPGTFQQYVVSSATYVTPIPDGIDLAEAAPLMCAGITVYTALKRAGTRFGDWVLISGAGGGLGHLAIQYAKAIGARVIALDHGSKKAFCEELGADAFVDFTKFSKDEELKEEVWKIAKNGVKTVLCCASNNRAYEQALNFLGFRGTLVCVGVPPQGGIGESLGSRVVAMIGLELTIFGTYCMEIQGMQLTCGSNQSGEQTRCKGMSGHRSTRLGEGSL
jgi:propanol-preferring alcohol dehydrogenase